MKTKKIALLAFVLLMGQVFTAAAERPAESNAVPVQEPSAAGASKARKASVPETPKDRENKKKCRSMGGTWQLGHCNVG